MFIRRSITWAQGGVAKDLNKFKDTKRYTSVDGKFGTASTYSLWDLEVYADGQTSRQTDR